MKLRNKKTGEITEATITVCKWTNDYEDMLTEAEYENISDVMRDWEDYKPKQPLIKDEKIRKAVRAWAEANDIHRQHYHNVAVEYDRSEYRLTWIETGIEFNEREALEDLDDGGLYTIAELCGEEE